MNQEMRKFGLVTGGMIALIFGLILPWVWGFPWPRWPWIVAGCLALPALVYPPVLKPVHFVWMKFAHAL
ncbi:MAG: sxtJ, partial [bacterium]|nr:sxtJ [bacterium]